MSSDEPEVIGWLAWAPIDGISQEYNIQHACAKWRLAGRLASYLLSLNAFNYDVSKQTAHVRPASQATSWGVVTYLLLLLQVEVVVVHIADASVSRRRVSPGLFSAVTRGAVAEPLHLSRRGPPLALS